MSDALTPEAQAEGEAVAEAAPESEVSAEGVSAGGEETKVVPAERFNGLQSRYQSDKAEWERRIAAAEAELEALRAEPKETEPVSDDVAELKQTVESLAEMLMKERQESAVDKALKEFPDAAPFADMLVGHTPEEVREAARMVSERVALVKGPGSTETSETTTEESTTAATTGGEVTTTEAAPETGGAAVVAGTEAIADVKAEALKNKDFTAFFNAAVAEQQAASQLVG
jgi:hypothetical protein